MAKKGHLIQNIGQHIAYGKEPDFKGVIPNQKQLGDAYTWYSTFYDWADVKKFTVQYLILKNVKRDIVNSINKANDWDLNRSTGWHCRMLLKGAILPDNVMAKLWKDVAKVAKANEKTEAKDKTVIPYDTKIHSYLEFLEGKLDDVVLGKSQEKFDMIEWIKTNNVSPIHAAKIAARFKPIYKEMYDSLYGKDEELKFAYHYLKPQKIKEVLEFLKGYIAADAIRNAVVIKPVRKERKKKVKPASVLVAKLNYKTSDPVSKLTSIPPQNIVGMTQLWTFNTKTRFLTVFLAEGDKKLSVKGSTLQGFDAKLSLTKKVRKPEKVLPEVMNAGKVALRKIMDGINAVGSSPTGRVNKATILMRAL